MQGYFIQFLAYTMAMVGFLSVCLFVYKKLYIQTKSGTGSECLYIENALRLNPKKQIYIVRAGNERFLVASDAENTTMLAKLEENAGFDVINSSENKKQNTKEKTVKNPISLCSFKKMADNNSEKTSVFRKMKMKV